MDCLPARLAPVRPVLQKSIAALSTSACRPPCVHTLPRPGLRYDRGAIPVVRPSRVGYEMVTGNPTLVRPPRAGTCDQRAMTGVGHVAKDPFRGGCLAGGGNTKDSPQMLSEPSASDTASKTGGCRGARWFIPIRMKAPGKCNAFENHFTSMKLDFDGSRLGVKASTATSIFWTSDHHGREAMTTQLPRQVQGEESNL